MRAAALALTASLCLIPTTATAQTSGSAENAAAQRQATGSSGNIVVRPRRNVITIAASYGNAAKINGSVPTDVSGLWVRWTRRSRSRFLGGEPAWGVELLPVVRVSQEPTAYGAGGHLVYELRFAPEHRLRPLLRGGAGMVFTNRAVPVGETRYNFSLFAGVGLELEVGARRWLSLEYRLHHISNADTGDRNPGINAHTLGFGIGWAF